MKITSRLTACLVILSAFSVLVGCKEDTSTTKVKFYTKSFKRWADNYLKDAIKTFNEQNDDNIRVDIRIYNTNDDYNTALATAIENHNAPDVYLLAYPNLPQEVLIDNIIPVTKYLTTEDQNKYFDSVKEHVVFNNDYYMFPWYTEPSSVLYYRKDILESNGIEVPTTWDEMYAACEELSMVLDNGQYPLGMPISQADLSGFTWGLQYNFTGGLALNDAWTEHRLNEPGYKELSEVFYNLAKNKYIPRESVTSDGAGNLATSLCKSTPTCIMAMTGSWQISQIYEDFPTYKDLIGIAPMVSLAKNAERTCATNGGWGFVLSNQSSTAKQDAAAKFVKWLTLSDPEIASQYFAVEHMAKFPANKEVSTYLKNSGSAEINMDWFTTVETVSATAIREPMYSFDINFAVGTMFQACVLNQGNKDFESLYAASLQTAINRVESLMSSAGWKPNPFV